MNWLKQLFSDAPGVSFGRVASFVALGAVIVWVTIVVWRTTHIPDLAGLTAFALSFYGAGKLMGKAAEVLGKKDDGNPPQQNP